MRDIIFRTLRADEIEVRPSHVKEGKANMLLYIDSRAVVSLLNETIGNMNWQSEFYGVNGQTIGRIGIYDEDRNLWVWKSDTGSESNIEAEKGLISDIYKRVMSRWGVCELYSAPRISVPDDGYGNSGYKVSEILYNDHREITHLVIVNKFNKEVYRWDRENPSQVQTISATQVQTQPQPESSITTPQDKRVFVDDSRKVIIQSITDRASKESLKEGVNHIELQKFVDFYVNKIKSDGWKGAFNFDTLFSRWMQNSWNKVS